MLRNDESVSHSVDSSIVLLIPSTIPTPKLLIIPRLIHKTPLGLHNHILEILNGIRKSLIISKDDTYGNKAWAEVAKMPAADVCQIEREFLTCIKFDIFVGWQDWKQYNAELEFALNNYTVQRYGVGSGLEGLVYRVKVWDERDQERVDSGGFLSL
jgi:hypothetical protein